MVIQSSLKKYPEPYKLITKKDYPIYITIEGSLWFSGLFYFNITRFWRVNGFIPYFSWMIARIFGYPRIFLLYRVNY